MAKSLRLTLSRKKGFNLQAASRAANGLAAITVARPSRWGNPFVIGQDGTPGDCVARYRTWLGRPEQEQLRLEARLTLAGRNLACWCVRGTPCHGDALLELANPGRAREADQ